MSEHFSIFLVLMFVVFFIYELYKKDFNLFLYKRIYDVVSKTNSAKNKEKFEKLDIKKLQIKVESLKDYHELWLIDAEKQFDENYKKYLKDFNDKLKNIKLRNLELEKQRKKTQMIKVINEVFDQLSEEIIMSNEKINIEELIDCIKFSKTLH